MADCAAIHIECCQPLCSGCAMASPSTLHPLMVHFSCVYSRLFYAATSFLSLSLPLKGSSAFVPLALLLTHRPDLKCAGRFSTVVRRCKAKPTHFCFWIFILCPGCSPGFNSQRALLVPAPAAHCLPACFPRLTALEPCPLDGPTALALHSALCMPRLSCPAH